MPVAEQEIRRDPDDEDRDAEQDAARSDGCGGGQDTGRETSGSGAATMANRSGKILAAGELKVRPGHQADEGGKRRNIRRHGADCCRVKVVIPDWV